MPGRPINTEFVWIKEASALNKLKQKPAQIKVSANLAAPNDKLKIW